MTLKIGDRLRQTSTTTGTGTLNLIAASTGDVNFKDIIGSGNTVLYVIDDGVGNWEIGVGTVTSGTPDTLSRDTVKASSNSNSLVNFPAGTKTVISDVPSSCLMWHNSTFSSGDVPLHDGAKFANQGTSGTGNIARVGSPAFTGTMTAAAATFSGAVTLTGSGASNAQVLTTTGATTGSIRQNMQNTGGQFWFGLESSAGGQIASGGAAYATVLATTGATSLQLGANSSVGLTLDSSLRVGVGMTPVGANYMLSTNVSSGTNTTGMYVGGALYGYYQASTTSVKIGTNAAIPAIVEINGSEALRAGSDKSVLVNTTTNGGWSGVAKLEALTTASGGIAVSGYVNSGGTGAAALSGRVNNTADSLAYWNYNGSTVGTVTTNGSATAYNTSSDEDLKIKLGFASNDNVPGVTGNLFDQIKVYRGFWKSNPNHAIVDTFLIAQEVEQLMPHLVTPSRGTYGQPGWAPAQLNYGGFMPHVIAEIKALRDRLAYVENQTGYRLVA